jgi:hypothetical protein
MYVAQPESMMLVMAQLTPKGWDDYADDYAARMIPKMYSPSAEL